MQELTAAGLRLMPLREAHAAGLHPVLADPAIYRFIPFGPYASAAELAARYRRLESRQSTDGTQRWLNWAVVVLPEAQHAGVVEVTLFADGEAALAYQLGPAFWGRGLAYAACRVVCDHLVDHYGATRFTATVDTRNQRSIRLLERLGFTRELTRDSEDVIDGLATTEHIYGWMPVRRS